MISNKHRLDGGDAKIVDRPVRLDAADDGREESFRVWRPGDDRAGKRTTEEGRDVIRGAGGFAEDLPQRRKLRIWKPTSRLFGELPNHLQTLLVVMELCQK